MIYNFEQTDKIMGILGVDPIQFHLLFLLYHRNSQLSTSAQIERFKDQILTKEDTISLRKRIDDLEEKGLIDNVGMVKSQLGGRYKTYDVDTLIVTEKFTKSLIAVDAGEELWDKYPRTLPLGEGRSFISRLGDKDYIISLYNRKIKKDIEKHRMIIDDLEKYEQMVKSSKINGVKIENYINSEMWDIIHELDETSSETVSNHEERA